MRTKSTDRKLNHRRSTQTERMTDDYNKLVSQMLHGVLGQEDLSVAQFRYLRGCGERSTTQRRKEGSTTHKEEVGLSLCNFLKRLHHPNDPENREGETNPAGERVKAQPPNTGK